VRHIQSSPSFSLRAAPPHRASTPTTNNLYLYRQDIFFYLIASTLSYRGFLVRTSVSHLSENFRSAQGDTFGRTLLSISSWLHSPYHLRPAPLPLNCTGDIQGSAIPPSAARTEVAVAQVGAIVVEGVEGVDVEALPREGAGVMVPLRQRQRRAPIRRLPTRLQPSLPLRSRLLLRILPPRARAPLLHSPNHRRV
jgi:hypothetical protein